MYMYMRISKNHNSLGCEQPLGLDVNQSPDAQDAFRPIPGLISCAGMYVYMHQIFPLFHLPPICAANVLDHQSTTGIVALSRQCLSCGGGARCGEERVATLGSHLSLEGPPCSAIQSNWKILCQNILDGMYIHVYLFLRNFQHSTQPGQHASLRLCTTTTVCIHVLSVECSGLLEKDLCH